MSVPDPPPRRRPIWQLVIGAVALAVGIFSFIRAASDPNIDGLRWFTTWLWLLVGAFWIVQWRKAVARFDRES